jgi:hypothetical protein
MARKIQTSPEKVAILKNVLDCVERRFYEANNSNNVQLAQRELETFAILACY